MTNNAGVLTYAPHSRANRCTIPFQGKNKTATQYLTTPSHLELNTFDLALHKYCPIYLLPSTDAEIDGQTVKQCNLF